MSEKKTERDAKLLESYAILRSTVKVAAEFGITRHRVSQILKANGVQIVRTSVTKDVEFLGVNIRKDTKQRLKEMVRKRGTGSLSDVVNTVLDEAVKVEERS